MARSFRYLVIFGDDIEDFSEANKADLANIIVSMLYKRNDIAAAILQKYDNESLLILSRALIKLSKLLELCLHEDAF